MADKQTLGVSLADIKTSRPKPENKQDKTLSEIAAYRKDAIRSVIIGGVSIALLVGLYFSNVIK